MQRVQYVDFVPLLLESEVPYSTLSLTGSRGGPKYESFSVTVQKANSWLLNHTGVSIVHTEVIEISGVYDCDFQADCPPKLTHCTAVPAFLKIIRLWYTQSDGNDVSQLSCVHVVPSRLETHPRAFNPKFQNLHASLTLFNKQLQEGDIDVEGQLMGVQTCIFRFNSRHCSLDPDRSFWMIDDVNEVHICFYFTVFFVKSGGQTGLPLHAIHEIYFKDFAAKVVRSGNRRNRSVRKSENVSVLMDQMRVWQTNTNAKIMNIQTVDHSAYYQCAIDSPGMEDKSLPNPHYRSSLSGLQRCSKLLRVYYFMCETCCCPFNDGMTISCSDKQVMHKSFIGLHKPIPLSQVNLGKPDTDLHVELEHRILVKSNEWLEMSHATVIGVETLKLGINKRRCKRSSVDDTQFLSTSTVDAGAIYAVRLYTLQPEGSLLRNDIKSVPNIVSLCSSQCVVM